MRGHIWVTIGVGLVDAFGRTCVLPIRSRLVPEKGNRSKLRIAQALVRALLGHSSAPVRVLFDAWFMRRTFILPIVRRQVRFIGRDRHDTALFLPSAPRLPGQVGAPRKYGQRLPPAYRAEHLPVTETTIFIYGEEQRVRLQSALSMARFLNAMPARAVWCQIFDGDKGHGRPPASS